MRSPCRCRSALATVLLALLAAAPVLAAVTPANADGGQRESHAVRRHLPAARVQLVGVNREGQEHRGAHFSAQRLRDVIVVVRWRTLVGSHTQRLELIAPDGSVYQTFRASAEATVETHVPVAGSWITDYSLYGAWRVHVYLDENATPEASESFVLTR